MLFAQPNCPPTTLLCSADTMLYDVLKVFRFGRSHMSALTAPGPTGSHEVRAVGAVPAVPAVCVCAAVDLPAALPAVGAAEAR